MPPVVRAVVRCRGCKTPLSSRLALAFTLAFGGFLIGFALGVLARPANYRVMGAISVWRLIGDIVRPSATALAAAVAITGAQGLSAAGVVALSPRMDWFG